mmetsp:Transcript_79392/g.220925  ORF Transcript_79392/g.220925 Transcript_79392/m.220925 type:complete len:263 (-) Transcript_79392:464-1252(-)
MLLANTGPREIDSLGVFNAISSWQRVGPPRKLLVSRRTRRWLGGLLAAYRCNDLWMFKLVQRSLMHLLVLMLLVPMPCLSETDLVLVLLILVFFAFLHLLLLLLLLHCLVQPLVFALVCLRLNLLSCRRTLGLPIRAIRPHRWCLFGAARLPCSPCVAMAAGGIVRSHLTPTTFGWPLLLLQPWPARVVPPLVPSLLSSPSVMSICCKLAGPSVGFLLVGRRLLRRPFKPLLCDFVCHRGLAAFPPGHDQRLAARDAIHKVQ